MATRVHESDRYSVELYGRGTFVVIYDSLGQSVCLQGDEAVHACDEAESRGWEEVADEYSEVLA